MSKEVHHDAAAPGPGHHKPVGLAGVLPKPVLIVCIVLILIGVILQTTRTARLENEAYTAIENCDTSTFQPYGEDRKRAPVNDGLNEMYGVVQFKSGKNDVVQLLTYCETEPKLALDVYRRAMTNGSASAKTVAAYSAFFLANRGVLEASDFDLLLKCLDKAQPLDLRKVAQRTVSDLTLIKNTKDPGQYEQNPADLPPLGADEQARVVKTNPEKYNGLDILSVRWSSPDLAEAWWKAQASKGAWDPAARRFVIP